MEKQILFRYCKLKRAAEMLSVHASDLINLAVMGDIDCLVKLDGAIAKYYLWSEHKKLIDTMESLYQFGLWSYEIHSRLEINTLSLFRCVRGVCKPLNTTRDPFYYYYKGKGVERYGLELDINASGLWVLSDSVINELENRGEATVSSTLFYIHNDIFNHSESFIEPYLDEKIKVCLDDLYITSEDLIRIINGEFDKKSSCNKPDNLSNVDHMAVIGSMLLALKKAQPSSKRWTQESLIGEMMGTSPVSERILEGYFSEANKRLKSNK
ncbi:hypothetical protein AB7X32_14620 [Morganella morganii]|uniref:hypothetical protein n=1 Tax=Morganella morganii TaxID=582 RepID=UPI0034E4E8E6